MGSVVEKLRQYSRGPWSYATYMNVALYDEEMGYYTSDKEKLGKSGDFYTSNHVHHVFGRTFARFFADVFEREELTPTIYEWGAGDGKFALSVLEYFRNEQANLYKNLTYVIIESSSFHREVLDEILREHREKVYVFGSLENAKQTFHIGKGILFSNELIDAFPVHVVEKKSDELFEVMVSENEEGLLEETLEACSNEQLTTWLDKYGPNLPEGHRIEISLEMKEWLTAINEWFDQGLIVTVDYGYSNEEWVQPEHKEGSLRGYYQHELIRNPLKFSGEMDITYHIQWDAFNDIAKECGLKAIFHDKQDQFLKQAGLFRFLMQTMNANPFSEEYKQNRAIQTLVHPGGISSSFHVNVQSKDLHRTEDYRLFTEDPYSMK
ncbi:SAM-dependent methyltransferase [Bacillus shivajii]|uniref:SAM-dependent methyltransferase n=1 Tax=Bacillus shivajii TaxID=1983719 RepID=UPI001CF9DD15|nr:SAM-dependent methyltransferase [Bacillus shivajii]UCZ54567.1 SAM-dependent methyltransferase [Bacillus shivajii]